ncbi:MAG: hydrogenase iron-sulfur subunit [Candidatus Helarchaeota archaeon]|nr:hydrogenase iron-sulfur subunit [Candidatus Helarchaeota archaeon]
MSGQDIKVAIVLCSCGKTLENQLDYNKIQDHFKENTDITELFYYENLCFKERLDELIGLFEKKIFDWFILAACTPQIIEMPIKNKLKDKNLNPNFEIVNIREQCAWVHSNKKKATDKAICLIQGAISKVKQAIIISRKEASFPKHVTVIGGGISGLNVAVDLCTLGFDVLVVEQSPWLGGHLIQLENIFPFNISGKEIILDCLKNLDRKNVKFALNTRINWIEGGVGDFRIHTLRAPTFINENCNNCKKCIEICPTILDDPLNKGLATIKAIDKGCGAPFGESLVITRAKCPINCKLCEEVCPEKAIKLSQDEIEEIIQSSFIVFSTGYELYEPDERSVYQMERTSDILTQLQLARMLDPEGPTQGKIIRPSTREVAKKILVVQCVGSRDIRQAEYCSKYCCSSAIRHAIEIKERNPDCNICISYIDIRTPFWDEEIYREARELGIEFIRGKIGNIGFESKQFVTEIIDTVLARQINYESDIIVLSTAMLPSKMPPEISEITNLKIKKNGFIQEYYPKLKLTETNKVGIYICGSVAGPKLVSECIADAHSVAVSIVKEFPSETLIRETPISIVDEELCNGCELCVRLCPFKIPILIEKDEKTIAVIDQKQCQGCGTCVSLCPTNAVQLESLQRDQFFAQIKGLLADAPSHDEPIILGFVCEECAYATIDFAGMLRESYSATTRFIRLPCVGRLSILDILTAFEYGADLILIFGCEEEKCHYLEGNSKTKVIIEVVKELLTEIGWESERIKMYGLFSADVYKFVEAIQNVLGVYEKLGHSPARLKMLDKFGK